MTVFFSLVLGSGLILCALMYAQRNAPSDSIPIELVIRNPLTPFLWTAIGAVGLFCVLMF